MYPYSYTKNVKLQLTMIIFVIYLFNFVFNEFVLLKSKTNITCKNEIIKKSNHIYDKVNIGLNKAEK